MLKLTKLKDIKFGLACVRRYTNWKDEYQLALQRETGLEANYVKSFSSADDMYSDLFNGLFSSDYRLKPNESSVLLIEATRRKCMIGFEDILEEFKMHRYPNNPILALHRTESYSQTSSGLPLLVNGFDSLFSRAKELNIPTIVLEDGYERDCISEGVRSALSKYVRLKKSA